MRLINTDDNLLRKFFNADKMCLYVSLKPYKNNTAIKVYSDEGEPIGDIPEEDISNYIAKNSEVLFIKEEYNDDTGLFDLIVETML